MFLAIKRSLRAYWQLYIFLLLPVLYILTFKYYPMTGIQLAFKKFDYGLGLWGSPWVGFENFNKFFSSYMFKRVMTNTIFLSLYGLIAEFPIPIFFALALSCMSNLRLKKTVQTITYMPHFISMVVLVGMLQQILHPTVGLYGVIKSAIFGDSPPDIFANPNAFSSLYVLSGVWQGFGWSSILYIAALSSVSDKLHEAAQIDGASHFKRVLHIDIPAIMPTIIIVLIMRMGSLLGIGFEKIYLMQNDLNLRVSEVISTYVYKRSLGSGGKSDFAFSTAVGLFNNLINLVLLITVNKIASKVSETSLW